MSEASSSKLPCLVLFPPPSLKALKLATAANLLDPTKRICQYEIPGGGVCRNDECEDVHLSRIVRQGDLGDDPNGACCVGLVLCFAHLLVGLLKSSKTLFLICVVREMQTKISRNTCKTGCRRTGEDDVACGALKMPSKKLTGGHILTANERWIWKRASVKRS
jgi:hypothetical protein